MATELAQAYVQIIPSAKGIQGSISSAIGGEASSAGTSAGMSIASKIKGALVAAGIGKILKDTIMEGGALEQSFGGLDTIYGEASDAAKAYAAEAANAGISMNNYAEQAVSFGASLKQAFGGDTTAAAQAANTAILDMADNSAKMGTSIESIQTAYQGFAKQNYTMLDNLKLGYGGTKTEMQRLLADAEKLSGVKYDINNLGDVYEAIHVVQGELGLTGVAAAEASGTLTGSLGAMKAGLSNLMGSLSTGMDITPALTQLCQATGDFLFKNLIPMVGNIVKSLPGVISQLVTTGIPTIMNSGMEMINGLVTGMTTSLPSIIQQGSTTLQSFLNGILESLPNIVIVVQNIITTLCDSITTNLPTILNEGVQIITNLFNGILQQLPDIITAGYQIMTTIATTIMENLPTIQQKGVELLQNLINGIIQNLPAIVSAAANGIAQFAAGIASNLPTILQKGIELLGQLAAGIIQAIPQLIGKLPQVFKSIVDAFAKYDWLKIGLDIIAGIGKGIIDGVGSLVGAAIDACGQLVGGILDFFGIHSPSRLMRDEVGKYIPAGIAVGIEDNLTPVKKAMDEMDSLIAVNAENRIATRTLDNNASMNSAYSQGLSTGTNYTQNVTINAPTELNPSEIARQTRNQARQVVLAMSGV